jgi:predicted RNase H-like HicB family nuclease
MKSHEYLVLLERAGQNFCAYSPDLPGCVAAVDPHEDTLGLMREAMEGRLRLMCEEGLLVPPAPSADPMSGALEASTDTMP